MGEFETDTEEEISDEMMGEMGEELWKQNPDAQKVVHHVWGMIVPTWQGRTDVMKNFLTILIDYDKLKVRKTDKPDASLCLNRPKVTRVHLARPSPTAACAIILRMATRLA